MRMPALLSAAPPVRRLIDRRREESVGGHRCQSTTSWRRWGVSSRESEYEKKFTAEATRGEQGRRRVRGSDVGTHRHLFRRRKKNGGRSVRSSVFRGSSED